MAKFTNMPSPKLLLLLCFGLTACQPKGSLLYQYPDDSELKIRHLVVVMDYLNLKDDLGTYWDFDSQHHRRSLNHMLTVVNQQTLEAGYPKIENYLLSSGLLIKTAFAVDHYLDDQLQAERLLPPYLLATEGIDHQHIDQHQEILTLLVKYIAPRRHRPNNELSDRGMQMGYQMAALDLPDDTGLLYVHIDQSAPGIIKQTSSLLLAGAVASQADYAAVHLDATSTRQASAALIHKGSGQILWKNHSRNWQPSQGIAALLLGFPTR